MKKKRTKNQEKTGNPAETPLNKQQEEADITQFGRDISEKPLMRDWEGEDDERWLSFLSEE